MSCNRIVISSGHGKYVRGASGPEPWGLDEVDEARSVVNDLAEELKNSGIDVVTYHDDVSKSQDENLKRITDFHNSKARDLDISVHFNASDNREGHGVEVFYYSRQDLAAQVSAAIARTGFKDRGAKEGKGLYFLANTEAPSILIEVCFCDNKPDAELYKVVYDEIIANIADALGADDNVIPLPPPDTVTTSTGTCSWFGGPDDSGVSPGEGLAFIYEIDEQNQWLFLPMQPTGTTGLARRLNPHTHYCAMRWDYSKYPKNTLLSKTVLVRNPATGFALTCTPADWGPHEEKTGRVIDLSPSMMADLDLQTDDVVEVTFPYTEEMA